jgi:acyl carrier protein
VEQDQILSFMKAYFADRHGPDQLDNFEILRAADLIEDSMDAVTFILHLEDTTGRNIPLAEAGPRLTSLTFKELAAHLCAC